MKFIRHIINKLYLFFCTSIYEDEIYNSKKDEGPKVIVSTPNEHIKLLGKSKTVAEIALRYRDWYADAHTSVNTWYNQYPTEYEILYNPINDEYMEKLRARLVHLGYINSNNYRTFPSRSSVHEYLIRK